MIAFNFEFTIEIAVPCLEDFLSDLEDQLDRGEITKDEAIQMIRDFNGGTT